MQILNALFRYLPGSGNEAVETGGGFDGEVDLPVPESGDDAALHQTQTLQTKAQADQARLTPWSYRLNYTCIQCSYVFVNIHSSMSPKKSNCSIIFQNKQQKHNLYSALI